MEEPKKAIEAFSEFPQFATSIHVIEGLLSGLIVSDPASASRLLVSPLQKMADRYLHQVIQAWVRRDIEAVKAFVLQNTHGRQLRTLMAVFLNAWATLDAGAASLWAADLKDPFIQNQALSALLPFARSLSTETVDAVISNLPDGELRERWLSEAILQFPPDQARAALEWIERFPTGRLKSVGMTTLAEMWAKSDPKAAVAYFSNLRDGPPVVEIYKRIAKGWATTDPSSALAWSVQGDQTLAQELALIVLTEASRNSVENLPMLYSEIVPQSIKAAVTYPVLDEVAARKPEFAANWVAESMSGELRNNGMRITGERWGGKDPEGGFGWLQNLSPEDRDFFLRGFVLAADDTRPDLAAYAANLHSHEDRRMMLVTSALVSWVKIDEASALAWLDSIDVPDLYRPYIEKAVVL